MQGMIEGVGWQHTVHKMLLICLVVFVWVYKECGGLLSIEAASAWHCLCQPGRILCKPRTQTLQSALNAISKTSSKPLPFAVTLRPKYWGDNSQGCLKWSHIIAKGWYRWKIAGARSQRSDVEDTKRVSHFFVSCQPSLVIYATFPDSSGTSIFHTHLDEQTHSLLIQVNANVGYLFMYLYSYTIQIYLNVHSLTHIHTPMKAETLVRQAFFCQLL